MVVMVRNGLVSSLPVAKISLLGEAGFNEELQSPIDRRVANLLVFLSRLLQKIVSAHVTVGTKKLVNDGLSLLGRIEAVGLQIFLPLCLEGFSPVLVFRLPTHRSRFISREAPLSTRGQHCADTWLWYKRRVSTIDPTTAPDSIREWLAGAQKTVDAELDSLLRLPDLPGNDPVFTLAEAMRYAVLGPGKRLRPALVLASCEACGAPAETALPAAAAIEMLHAYTLVHDDLPAMDDDAQRRGRATVHIEYGEATAILVGDALLTLSFKTLASLKQGSAEAVGVLASRAGHDELLAGQMLDLRWQASDHSPSLSDLERLHAAKTGALFSAACELGAIAAGASPQSRGDMASYGLDVGIAFQHADDLDDGDFAEQSDNAGKRRLELAARAEQKLQGLGDSAACLRSFAQWIGSAS